MQECDVCYGTPGKYPIIDRYGSQRYEIRCPECHGTMQDNIPHTPWFIRPEPAPDGQVAAPTHLDRDR